ncbi:MAG: Uncharacterized protein G01um10147_885 [Microgenomates group bacterium Gr01-1014_7]|nr:MAG: Uncharacterized protein G01um10147_885 [Microgenomates group bacterium Gr01-1014_7]
MSKRFIITIITLVVIAVAAAIAIFLAKGYTVSTKEKRIVGTGIINITSEPDAASVFIDGHLTTATNATVSSLAPKIYSVKVIKEGFIPWEREVEVKEGLVTPLKITLFPAIPTMYPLTFTGVANPVLSADGSKLVFIVASGKKAGVSVWTMSRNQPIAFARSSEPHQITTNSEVDYSKASLRWSPDSKQVLATVGKNNYLLNDDTLNTEPRDITAILDSTLKSWDDDTKAKDLARIEAIKDLGTQKLASSSSILRFSPDETKFMFAEENIKFKVYDIESKKQYDLPSAKSHVWLPDSRHVILVDDNTVSVIDFDGTNKAVIYAGKFEDSFVFPWPDSSRLVIISSFPTPTASEPNLYGINLR